MFNQKVIGTWQIQDKISKLKTVYQMLNATSFLLKKGSLQDTLDEIDKYKLIYEKVRCYSKLIAEDYFKEHYEQDGTYDLVEIDGKIFYAKKPF